MDSQQLLQTSMEIMKRYYNNDIEMALAHFHSDILWVGPMQGQMIRTKEALVDAFRKDTNTMTFNLFDMRGQVVHSTTKQVDILLTYMVDSFYPDKSVVRVDQRIFFSWVPEKITHEDGTVTDEPRMRLCMIGNSMPSDNRDSIYPNHFVVTNLEKYYVPNAEHKHFDAKGKHAEALYFDASEVIYIESKRSSSIIHTNSGDYECAETITELHEKLADSFVRSHNCYLVNPLYIRSVQRFSVTLLGGRSLPIPEKRYTKIKAEINQRVNKID